MTGRLIDLLCDRHRAHILTTRIWPADCKVSGHFASYLDCPDCGKGRIPCGPLDPTEQAAVHEAGHAVLYLDAGATIEHAQLDPGQPDNGRVRFSGSMTRDGFVGGIWGGVSATLHWLDRMRMLDDAMIVDMVACGWGDAEFALQHVPDLTGADAARVADLVADRWDAIERVADALLAAGRLSGEEITAIAGIGVAA